MSNYFLVPIDEDNKYGVFWMEGSWKEVDEHECGLGVHNVLKVKWYDNESERNNIIRKEGKSE